MGRALLVVRAERIGGLWTIARQLPEILDRLNDQDKIIVAALGDCSSAQLEENVRLIWGNYPRQVIVCVPAKGYWEVQKSGVWSSQFALPDLQQVVIKNKIDRVIFWSEYAFAEGFSWFDGPTLYFCRLLNKPLIHRVEMLSDVALDLKLKVLQNLKIRMKAEERALRQNQCSVISNSQTTTEDLGLYYRPYPRPWLQLVNGHGLGHLEPLKFRNFKRREGAYWGRLNIEKGVHRLAQLADKMRLNIFARGSGHLSSNLAQQPFFKVLPFNEPGELLNWVRQYDFAFFPSIYEPRGLSLTEGLALGMICLAQRGAGGHEEQIIHGQNGFLIDFACSQSIDEIQSIINLSDERLREISIAAIESARSSSLYFSGVRECLDLFCQR